MAGPMAIGGGIIGVIVLLVNAFLGGEVDLSQLQVQEQRRPMSPQEQAAEDSLAAPARHAPPGRGPTVPRRPALSIDQ